MSDIAIQMWTVRSEADRALPETLERLRAVGYRAVETAGLYGRPPEEMARLLDANGLRLASTHHAIPEPGRAAETFDALAEMGATLCFCSLPEEHWTSEGALQRAVEAFNAAVDAARDWGISLGYHNHWWEFVHRIGARPAYETFLELIDPQALLEVDTYWVEVGGASAADLLTRLRHRAPCLHIKDGPGDRLSANVAVGDGVLDIPTILAAGSEATWRIVEMDECDGDVWEAIDRSLQYLCTR